MFECRPWRWAKKWTQSRRELVQLRFSAAFFMLSYLCNVLIFTYIYYTLFNLSSVTKSLHILISEGNASTHWSFACEGHLSTHLVHLGPVTNHLRILRVTCASETRAVSQVLRARDLAGVNCRDQSFWAPGGELTRGNPRDVLSLWKSWNRSCFRWRELHFTSVLCPIARNSR